MPLLTYRDPLVTCPARVLVAGTSGAGKTTLAVRIAAVLAVPHVEMDSLFHGAGWTPRSSFMDDVETFTARPAWVTEWQYRQARPLLAQRADLMVWLDLGRPTVMRQLVMRTLRRRVRRQVLWNGNVESPLRTILTDPDHVVRWAWSTHAKNTGRIGELLSQHPGFPVVRVRSHREARAWLTGPLSSVAR